MRCIILLLFILTAVSAYAQNDSKNSDAYVKRLVNLIRENNQQNTVANKQYQVSEQCSAKISLPTVKQKEIHRAAWQGIISLICGILGIIPLTSSILLAAIAILLGLAGLNKKTHKFTALAISGIILGIFDVVTWVMYISTLGWAALFAI